MPLFSPEFCEKHCSVCTRARKGHRFAKTLQKVELVLTFGGCPWGRARQRKYGVKPNEPLPSPRQPLPPAGQAVVEFNEVAITCRRPGLTDMVAWSDLRLVLIRTTAHGPFVDDMFWVLVGDQGGCVVPSEAEGAKELLRRLQELPGFDDEAAIRAATCTDEREFVCWKRDGAG